MSRAELADLLERRAKRVGGWNDPGLNLSTKLHLARAVCDNLSTILAALREPDEAAVERAAKALAKLEVPQADWLEDFTDEERADYRRCAGGILRAAGEG